MKKGIQKNTSFKVWIAIFTVVLSLADVFGGTLRITKNGRFAVINLPEGTTLADIADNENYRKYLNRIGLDYNNFATADEDVADDTEIRSGYLIEDPMMHSRPTSII